VQEYECVDLKMFVPFAAALPFYPFMKWNENFCFGIVLMMNFKWRERRFSSTLAGLGQFLQRRIFSRV